MPVIPFAEVIYHGAKIPVHGMVAQAQPFWNSRYCVYQKQVRGHTSATTASAVKAKDYPSSTLYCIFHLLVCSFLYTTQKMLSKPTTAARIMHPDILQMANLSTLSFRARIWPIRSDDSLDVIAAEITALETPHARPKATLLGT